jgi:hypothetical protein
LQAPYRSRKAPKWLLDLVTAKGVAGDEPREIPAIPPAKLDRARAYAESARRRELDRLAKAPKHQRNDRGPLARLQPACQDGLNDARSRHTIAAAEEAGFPNDVRLLEEPQAAFYCWLEKHDAAHALWQRVDGDNTGLRHVLVIDIGGGTSDFSLFELRLNERSSMPDIKRVAVSEHILLGGDNIDLAIAHMVEPRLAGLGGQISGLQWDQLVASCRNLKEHAFAATGPPDERFVVGLAGRGSAMVAGSQAVTVTRAEIEGVLLDGFFPFCNPGARPYRTLGALKEWGLPYPSDGAVTRHLAEFLSDFWQRCGPVWRRSAEPNL